MTILYNQYKPPENFHYLKISNSFILSPTFTLHIENNIKYYLDIAKVMFSSGNGTGN